MLEGHTNDCANTVTGVHMGHGLSQDRAIDHTERVGDVILSVIFDEYQFSDLICKIT